MAHTHVPYTPGQSSIRATASPMPTVTGFSLFDASTPGLSASHAFLTFAALAVRGALIGSSLSL